MIILKIESKIKVNKIKEFEQAIEEFEIAQNLVTPGYRRNLFRNWKDSGDVLYTEEWQSEVKFKLHLQTNSFKALLGAMKLLGEIQTAQVVTSSKIQTLEKFNK